MNREWVIAGMVALLCHGLLLFGLRLQTAAVPLPASDSAVDVSLVDGAPAPASAPATPEPAVEPPPPEPVPPPPPVQPPEPPPPSPVPEPAPEPPPTPSPREQPVHHEPARPAHPKVAALKAAGPVQTAHSAGPARAAGAANGTASSGIRERYNPKPPYPPEARRLHQEGRVGLEVEVGADGRAISVRVQHSSGSAILDNAAVQAVQRWIFEPARVAGMAVAGRADVPVVFSLSGER